VFYRQNDSRTDTQTSAIKGPRSAAVALTFDVKAFNSDDFTRYGSTAQSIAGDGVNTYSYIDSVVYLRAQFAEYQLPIRIIKKD